MNRRKVREVACDSDNVGKHLIDQILKKKVHQQVITLSLLHLFLSLGPIDVRLIVQ